VLRIVDRTLTSSEADWIVRWRYEPPLDFYDLMPEDRPPLKERASDGYGYYPVADDGEFVGFVCFGPEARVTGQSAHAEFCDVGLGLRPDLVGLGLGTSLLPLALAFAENRFGATIFRAAVAAFNERAISLCRSAEFKVVREFDGPRNHRFVELVHRSRQEQRDRAEERAER
jgi:ribosomal-protein-alanine N-acetyltransferase